MGVRGMDISNHQSTMDVERVVGANDFRYVFILSNDGTFINKYFHAQADAAERGGAIVLPYVYLRPNWVQTVDLHLDILGGRYTGSIVDVEHGSGAWGEVWGAHNRLWDRGQRTPLVYFPNFYWQQVGSPDLTPLRDRVTAHWKSWYADNQPRPFDQALGQVPDRVWGDDRGGIPVRILQFTGTGRVNGYGGNVDLNYFPGSDAELADLLGGDDMAGWNDKLTSHTGYEATAAEWLIMTNVKAEEARDASQRNEEQLAEQAARIAQLEVAVGRLSTGTGHTLDEIAAATADAVNTKLKQAGN